MNFELVQKTRKTDLAVPGLCFPFSIAVAIFSIVVGSSR